MYALMNPTIAKEKISPNEKPKIIEQIIRPKISMLPTERAGARKE
jgi:hypothetical protein